MVRTRSTRGSALLLAVIITLMLVGIGGAFLAETVFRSKTQGSAHRFEEALLICDAALERARRALYVYRNTDTWPWDNLLVYSRNAPVRTSAQIKADFNLQVSSGAFTTYQQNYTANQPGLNTSNEAPLPASQTSPAPSDGASGVFVGWNIPYLGGAYHVLVEDNGDDTDADPLKDGDQKLVLSITATLRDGTQRRIEATIYYGFKPLNAVALGAIVANSDVDLNGNITVDGRDWDIDGRTVVDNGVFGIVTDAAISVGGAAATGGNGNAPPRRGTAAGSTDPGHTFATGFPAGPDEALEITSGTLKSLAQAAGTYFTSQAAYNAYLAVNGGSMPGGQIIYLEADPSPPFELGLTMNSQPSILVVHNPTSSTTIKNIHGQFKGVLFADAITHVNAGTDILGTVMSFSESPAGNVLGNGNSTVKFSSAVLRKLPSVGPNACQVLNWKKVLP